MQPSQAGAHQTLKERLCTREVSRSKATTNKDTEAVEVAGSIQTLGGCCWVCDQRSPQLGSQYTVEGAGSIQTLGGCCWVCDQRSPQLGSQYTVEGGGSIQTLGGYCWVCDQRSPQLGSQYTVEGAGSIQTLGDAVGSVIREVHSWVVNTLKYKQITRQHTNRPSQTDNPPLSRALANWLKQRSTPVLVQEGDMTGHCTARQWSENDQPPPSPSRCPLRGIKKFGARGQSYGNKSSRPIHRNTRKQKSVPAKPRRQTNVPNTIMPVRVMAILLTPSIHIDPLHIPTPAHSSSTCPLPVGLGVVLLVVRSSPSKSNAHHLKTNHPMRTHDHTEAHSLYQQADQSPHPSHRPYPIE